MEIKRAVERLASCSIIPFDEDSQEVCGLAIKALEKQILKKPNKNHYRPLKAAGWDYVCPICKCAVGINENAIDYTQEDEYCPSCGQKLDWSENNG